MKLLCACSTRRWGGETHGSVPHSQTEAAAVCADILSRTDRLSLGNLRARRMDFQNTRLLRFRGCPLYPIVMLFDQGEPFRGHIASFLPSFADEVHPGPRVPGLCLSTASRVAVVTRVIHLRSPIMGYTSLPSQHSRFPCYIVLLLDLRNYCCLEFPPSPGYRRWRLLTFDVIPTALRK